MSSSRFSATYAATVPSAGTLSFNDGNYDGRLGWREVTAAGGATNIVRSTVPSTSPSRHLTAYPDDLLESPLDVTSATVEYAPGEGTLPGATPPRKAGTRAAWPSRATGSRRSPRGREPG
jgi:nickel/cobalt exporter